MCHVSFFLLFFSLQSGGNSGSVGSVINGARLVDPFNIMYLSFSNVFSPLPLLARSRVQQGLTDRQSNMGNTGLEFTCCPRPQTYLAQLGITVTYHIPDPSHETYRKPGPDTSPTRPIIHQIHDTPDQSHNRIITHLAHRPPDPSPTSSISHQIYHPPD